MFVSRAEVSAVVPQVSVDSILRKLLSVTVMALCVACAALVAPAGAATPNPNPLPGSSFQAADGDQLKTATYTDWETYADTTPNGNNTVSTVLDAPLPATTGSDTFYAGKINQPNTWTLEAVAGGVTPGKSNALSSSTLRDPLTTNLFFYFAFIREEDSNSETLYGLELRKLTTTWVNDAGTTVPCRSNDDILFTYNVTPNTKNVTIEAFRWTSSAPGPASCPEGKFGNYSAVNLGLNAQGYMNFDDAVTNFIRRDVFTSSLEKGRFGEGAINLTAALGAGANPCFSFGQAQFYSLSSGESFSSAMQDMVTPAAIDVRNCSASGTKWRDDNGDGTKNNGEPGLQGWKFWVDYDDDGVIDANEPSGTSDATGAYVISGINPTAAGYDKNGTYRIHEMAPAGVTGYTCTYPTAGTTGAGVDSHGCYWSATFATSGNQTGFTFGNMPPADLSVVKTPNSQTVNAGDPISFTMVTTNAGLGTAKGVTLSDPLPDGVDWSISAQTDQSDPFECAITGTGNDQVLNCAYGDLATNATRSVTVTASTSFDACATYNNTATVDATNTPEDSDAGQITCVKPALSVVKTPNSQTVDAGDAISFTMVTTNDGPGTAKGVTLSDPLPDGVDWSISAQTDQSDPFECSITGTGNDQVLNCAYGDLADDATRSVTVTATTSFSACAVYNNTATVDATNSPEDSDDGQITCQAPALSVDKTPNTQTVNAGDAISFTMVTTNDGPGTAKGVTLSDPLPDGVDWSISAQTDQSDPLECAITGTGNDQVLNCAYGDLADDASRSVTVTATTSFDACATYNNTATVDATNSPEDSDAGQITCQAPALSVVKTPNSQTVNAGDAISFTMVTTNDGPGTAKGVTLSDPLPDGVDWSISAQTDQSDPFECSITGTGNDQVLNCAYGDLADDATRSVTVTATTSFSACAVYNNTATVDATNSPEDSDDGQITCLAPALSVDKTPNTQTVNAGDAISFTMVTTNDGPGTAKGVTLSDPLPDGVDWSISAQTDQSDPLECAITGTGNDQVLNCAYGDLADDASRSVTVTASTSFDACATYNNTATVDATNSPEDSDAGQITCLAPGLSVVKTPDAQTVNAGDAISFTMVTTNTGPGTASGVTLSDPLPDGVNWSISSQTDQSDPFECAITGTGNDQVLNCAYGDLADDATRSVTVTATTSFSACATYNNTATVDATNSPEDSDAGQITCLAPGLSVVKTPDAQTVNAGDAISFTMVTTNTGPGTASGVTLSDPLPDGVNWSISSQTDQSDPFECAITGTGNDQVLNCAYGDLADDATRSVTVTATTSFDACAVYNNTATVDATNSPEDSDAGQITCEKPDLSTDKAALNVVVDAGDDIEFTITTTNAGPGTAKGVTLSDPLPDGVDWSIVSQTDQSSPFECSISGTGNDQVLNCAYGDLAAAASRTVTVRATTSFDACAVYNNTATADATNAPADSDSATITCLAPSLSVEKTPNSQTVDAGDPISFTMVTTNAGPGTAKGVTLSDPLPDGVDWSISSQTDQSDPFECAITGTGNDQVLNCAYGDLADDASRSVTVTASTSFDACAVYNNTATVDATNSPEDSDAGQITCEKPALSVDKTPNSQTVDAGDAISFTMVTTNAGPGTAKGVTLSDPLPDGVNWSISSQTDQSDPFECAITGTGNDQVLNCAYGDLADDATRSVTVTATTSFSACATYDNTATVDATNSPEDSDAGQITCLAPGLSVEKTPNSQTVDAGDPISFTMVTTNAGPGTADDVTLSDPLPDGVNWSISSQTDQSDPFECSITGTGNDQVLNCAYGDLADDATRSVTVTATTSFDACAVYNNTATVDATNAPEDSDAGQITCEKPALSVVKTPDSQTVNAGDAVSFTMVTTNDGPGTAKGVTLSDPLPDGVNWSISAQTDQSDPFECTITGTGNDQVLNCAYGDMADNATRSVTVTATTSFDACATYNNTATVDATNSPEDSDAGQITCLKPDLSTDKAALNVVVDAGDDIEFTITTTNAGPGTAKGVTLHDDLPAGVTWTIVSQTDQSNPFECVITGLPDAQDLDCAYGDLADDATRTVTVRATTSFDACAVYDNTATADATNAPADSDSATITCQAPSLSVEKTPNSQTVDAGDPISFTIVTTNAGPGTAKGVTLSDPLPDGVNWSIGSQTDQTVPLECAITGTGNDQVLNCAYGDLADDATRSVTVTATTSFSACATYNNTATVDATNSPEDSDAGQITCLPPGLSVEKTPNSQTVDAGDAISFTMVTTNAGPGTADGVTLSDPLPNGVNWSISSQTDQSDPFECAITGTGDDQVLNCAYGDLADDATRSVTVTASTSFSACAVYDNTATVDATNSPEDSDAGQITCEKPGLSVVKTPDEQTVDAGDPISFTMVTANAGPGEAKGVTLSDDLPAGVTWSISAQTDQSDPFECTITGPVDNQDLDCAYGDLAAGQSRSVTVTAQTSFTDCAVYDNSATADATNSPSDTDSGLITCKRPALEEDKAALQVVVDAGDDISFTMTTRNTGEGTAKGVVLNDPLPDGVNWSIVSQTNAEECSITGAGNDQVLTCSYGDLAPGAVREVTVKATTSFDACTVYNNTATASAANAPSDSDDASVACNKPSVSIDKSTSTGTINAGDVAKFAVKVSNGGPGVAKNVVISDPLPAGPTWSFDGAAPAGCVLDAQKVTCTIASMASGASFTFNVQATTTQENCAVYNNTATGTGSNTGPIAPDSATVTCRKLPAISIDKSGPATATAGDRINYALAVKNTGPTSYAEGLVVLTDVLCEAPPILVSKGTDASPATLDPGETWLYGCTVQTQVGQTVVNNIGVVNGTDVNGNKAAAQDGADTVLSQPVVAGVSIPVVPGTAKLRGPSGCLLKPTQKVYVTGKQIQSVRFVLDKKTLKTVTKPDKNGRYAVTITRKKMKLGSHRVQAVVTFKAASKTKARTLQLRFSRCGEVKPARAKGFTG